MTLLIFVNSMPKLRKYLYLQGVVHKIEEQLVPTMRMLAANQQTILAQLQADSNRNSFDHVLVKNKLKKLLPIGEDTELTRYLFASIEIKNMSVDIMRDKFRKKKQKNISINDVANTFCDTFLHVKWMAHMYWHEKDHKRLATIKREFKKNIFILQKRCRQLGSHESAKIHQRLLRGLRDPHCQHHFAAYREKLTRQSRLQVCEHASKLFCLDGPKRDQPVRLPQSQI